MIPNNLLHYATQGGVGVRIGGDATMRGPVAAHAIRFVRRILSGEVKVGTMRSVLGAWSDRTDGRAPTIKSTARLVTIWEAIDRDPRCRQYDEQHPDTAPIAEAIKAQLRTRYNIG